MNKLIIRIALVSILLALAGCSHRRPIIDLSYVQDSLKSIDRCQVHHTELGGAFECLANAK